MKRSKELIAALLAAGMFTGCSASTPSTDDSASSSSTDKPVIGLAQLVDHSSLNTIRDAFLDEMEQLGYKDGETVTIDYKNAAGQTSNLDTIMSGYSSEGADVIVAIATPTAQAAQNYSSSIPVIFSAVSDPVGAGLVETVEAPGGNISGTSDEVQVDQIVDLMKELTPSARTVGVLYNMGEANSVSNVQRFKDDAEKQGLEVVEKTGKDLTELQQSATVLAQSVDVVFSPNDNTVASGMSALASIFADADVPYYVGADSMVQDGGFATVGINYEDLGRQTAQMVKDVLDGKNPGEMPVRIFKDDLNVYINKNTLEKLQSQSRIAIEIPEDLKPIYLGMDAQ